MSKSTITTTAAVDTVVITPVTQIPSPNIVSLRQRAVESESTVYGARRDYAKGINGLSDIAWYRDGVALPKAVDDEKREYYKALKAIGYSNPSNAWKMVKQYAFENAVQEGLFGEVPPELADNGEGEVAAESNTRETRSISLRLIEELTTLHKACTKLKDANSEEYLPKVGSAHHHVIEALKAMGVDIGI
jgi:hypothetical protein